MELQWNDHTLRVTGNFNGTWFFLTPEYQLWIDDECVDSHGVPTTRPRLDVTFEDDDGTQHEIEAELFSIVGFKPRCEVQIDGDLISTDNVRVQNILNPFLVLVIILSMAVMYFVGPEVLRAYMPGL